MVYGHWGQQVSYRAEHGVDMMPQEETWAPEKLYSELPSSAEVALQWYHPQSSRGLTYLRSR